jgi:hypothetical protein
MSESLLNIILTAAITLITLFASQRITIWLNKRKIVDESDLSRADLAKKYLDLANMQSDENTKLELQLQAKDILIQSKENEKSDIMSKYEELREEMKIMDTKHDTEINEVKDSFAKEIAELKEENRQWRSWALRLVMQVKSYNLTPVPFDPDDILKEVKESNESRTNLDKK